ncbi:unnamed protein product [Allacma fusca]|uniref:procollagen-proline 4-dioxygenase n=1 Tax=Allacma fusca TaxID=39272 RepID=A0A8J2KGG3_9HEXA|nr:unnamed protein product [Allacma fusca]
MFFHRLTTLLFFIWILNLLNVTFSKSGNEIFSSTTELEKLFKHESEVVKKLEEYALAMETNLLVIKRYIDDFNMIRKEGPTESSEVVANPVNAFHILKRTTVDWEDVLNSIKNHTKTDGLVDEVVRKGAYLPTFEDFIGGSMALVGLQDTYKLNLSDIIQGSIGEGSNTRRSPYELTARDCLFLGKAAFNKGLYDRAVGWLETALSRADEEALISSAPATASKEEILPFLETTRRVHDEVLEKRGPSGDTWQTFPTPLNPSLAKKKKYQKVSTYKPRIFDPLSEAEELENFKTLCREEELRNPELDAPLRCRLRRRPGTKSFLGPFKVEEKSLEPYIILIHDFMLESEINAYKSISSSRLRRSLHQGKGGGYVATDVRTSKQAWLTMDDDPAVDEFTKRIGELTGLEMFPENEASEVYQVANYGMAGRYNPHTDYITGQDHLSEPFEQLRGNRIATFMAYLENVHAGGSTVFPLTGVRVKPQKGAGVFWWNLRSDGSGDPLTRHGGCPVLYGEKWITNKWIRYNAQFQKVLCVPKGSEFIQEI